VMGVSSVVRWSKACLGVSIYLTALHEL
jgi:hypothetical protein